MPAVGGGGRGNAGNSTRSARRRARRAAPKPYSPPAGRSDAAQRRGKAPVPRYYSPNVSRAAGQPSPPSRSDAAQRRGKKPVRTVGRRKALRANQRAARQKRLVARHKLFPTQPFKATLRSERSAIEALSNLRAQDPGKYKRNQRSDLSNTIRDVANAADKGLRKGAEFAKKQYTEGTRVQKRAAGFTVDPSGVGREAIDIIANTPSGAYLTGAAAFEATKGRPQRGRKLVKDFKDTSALYPAVKGDFGEAAKRASKRPLTTALELGGVKALVGRGGGAAARLAPSKRVRGFADTRARPNLKLYDPKREGRGPEVQRKYSKDIVNLAAQKAYERHVRKGSRIRRRGTAAGTQRRPGRDPHVDRGVRLVPPNPLREGSGSAPNRARLKRRIDTRVASQQRAVELETRSAAKRASKEVKRGDQRVVQAARAEKTRAMLQDLVKTAKPAARKDLRRLLNLTDERLLREVDRQGRGALKPGGLRKTKYSADERATIAKSLARRARKGQYLTPDQKLAVNKAVGAQIQRDVRARKTPEPPSSPLGAMVAHGGLRETPRSYTGPERRAHPRATEPLRPQDFGSYLKDLSAQRAGPPRRVAPSATRRALTDVRAAPEEVPGLAAGRARREARVQNAGMLADEFGIPVGPRGFVKSRALAVEAAKKRPGLVPLKRREGEWVLVPKVVSDRLAAHAKVDEGPFRQGGGIDKATGLFKDVVLTTSSPARWLGGNVADIGMRTLFEGLTPADIARGISVDRRLRGAGRHKGYGLQGKQASASTTGGGLYGTADDLATMGKAGIPRKVWRGYKRVIYTLEHGIEKIPQHGAVGKAMRQETARQKGDLRGLLKLHNQQLENFAKGLGTNRAMEARIQFATEQVIGRWGKVSPAMRNTLSIAPFAQWLGAATRYVLVTLPVHHPIKTSILAGIAQMTEKERTRLGLSYFATPEKRAPDYQMGTLPLHVGQNKYGPTVEGIRTGRMTSLGTAAGTPWNIPEFVMPQVSSLFNALAGRSFTGEQLMYPNYADPASEGIPMDPIDRLPVAVGQQLESMVPFASAFRRSVLEGGEPSEPFSSILTPAVRPDFNYETGKFTPREGSVQAGLSDWLKPYAPQSKLYTLGAQRDIPRSQETTKTLKKWQKRKKLQKKSAAIDLRAAPTPTPTPSPSGGIIPLR